MASIAIAAPQESVWRVLSAVTSWPEWLPTVDGVEALDAGPLSPGYRYTVRQPKLRPATWVVTHLEPPRSFVWQARSPGLLMIAEHTVEASSPGSSHVTLRFSFEGLLGGLVGRLFRRIVQRYLTQEAASLRAKAEGQR